MREPGNGKVGQLVLGKVCFFILPLGDVAQTTSSRGVKKQFLYDGGLIVDPVGKFTGDARLRMPTWYGANRF
jgi:hypothetical protein